MQSPVTVLLTLVLLTPFTSAQEKTKAKPADKPAAGAGAAGAEMPKPGKEHAMLAKAEGTWDAVIDMTGPDGKPSQSKGVSVMKMSLGGFWLVDDFTSEFAGAPFQGHGMLGFDQMSHKFVQTWCDSMSSSVQVMEGTYDEKTKTMTLVGDGYNMTGQKVKNRYVSTNKDDNTTVFEMYETGADGKETKMMTITYKRRKA